jgi:hypothetical protein
MGCCAQLLLLDQAVHSEWCLQHYLLLLLLQKPTLAA